MYPAKGMAGLSGLPSAAICFKRKGNPAGIRNREGVEEENE